MNYMYVEGEVAFCNLKEHEMFDGKSQGKYSITLKLDETNAKALTDAGVLVKDYKGTPQRKFTTTNEIKMFNPDLSPWEKGEITYGSKVRLHASVTEDAFKDYGCSTYVNSVQVLSEAAGAIPDGFTPVEPPKLEDIDEELPEEEDLPF